MNEIKQIPSDAEFSKFEYVSMKITWLANTRPDKVFETSAYCKSNPSHVWKRYNQNLQTLKKVIKYVHDHKVSIHIPKLDCHSLRITAYSDAAFANNAELSSHLGRKVLLTDDNHNSIPVSYKSYRSRRVVRSVLSAEVFAFADLFDDAFAICKKLEFVLR